MADEAYFGGFWPGAAGVVSGCVSVWPGPPERDGSSIASRDPRKRKSRMIATPSRMPRAIPIARSPTLGKRPRIALRGSADAVEQAPVRPEGRLRSGDDRVGIVRAHRVLDQPARLRGMSVVGGLGGREVLAARGAGEAVEPGQALAL